MKSRKVIWAGAGLLLAASALGLWARSRGDRNPAYQTTTATRGSIESAVSATGNLNAVVTVQVGSQVSGNIKGLFADFNTRVKKGQLLARIDPDLFQARVNQVKANLDSAEAGLATARATLERSKAEISVANAGIAQAQANVAKARASAADAKSKYERSLKLFDALVLASQDRDSAQAANDSSVAEVNAALAQEQAARDGLRSAQAQYEIARTQVAGAQAQVALQAANLKQAEIDLAHTYILAPVDGTVVSRKVDVGQTVAASLQAPTLFEVAQDLAKMQVNTSVDEADIGQIHVGQEATFTVDAYPGRLFHGAVTEVRKAPNNVQNVVTYDVIVAAANPDLRLLPGMTANVKVQIAKRDGVLRIPNAALRFRPADAPAASTHGGRKAASGQTVWTLGGNGKPEPVNVRLGITDGAYSEVQSGDLAEGDAVITGLANKQAAQNRTPAGRGPRGPGF